MNKIRLANFNDIGPVVALGQEAVTSGAWGAVPFDLAHTICMTTMAIKQGMVIVAEHPEDGVIGFTYLRIQDWAWAPGSKFVEAICTYVEPSHRSEKARINDDGPDAIVAAALIGAAKLACESAGLPCLFSMVFGDHVEKRDRFIESCGLEYAGGNFLFVPGKAASAKEAA
jgi:hypothetical protein